MFLNCLFRSAKSRRAGVPPSRPLAPCRLTVEALDHRVVPATLSVGNATVTESVSGAYAEVVVTLSAPSKKTVTVDFTTADGTAVALSDYQPTFGKLTFAPGETAKTIQIPVIADAVIEPSETFLVNLGHAKNATIGDGQGEVSIMDDGVSDPSVYDQYWLDYYNGYFGGGSGGYDPWSGYYGW